MAEVLLLHRNRDLTTAECAQLRRHLALAQLTRLPRQHQTGTAQNSLLGARLLHILFRQRYPTAGRAFALSANAHGKPFLPEYPDFHFNITHSVRTVACAVDDAPIGIDVEELRPVNLKIAGRFFTPAEQAFILAHPAAEQQAAFYHIWTRKESYLKWLGKGLSFPLSSFDVHEHPPEGIYFHALGADAASVCHVCSISPAPPPVTLLSVEQLLTSEL